MYYQPKSPEHSLHKKKRNPKSQMKSQKNPYNKSKSQTKDQFWKAYHSKFLDILWNSSDKTSIALEQKCTCISMEQNRRPKYVSIAICYLTKIPKIQIGDKNGIFNNRC